LSRSVSAWRTFLAAARKALASLSGSGVAGIAMMIELFMVDGSRGGYELLAGYEDRLSDLAVRPHWG
jgi:hypothetical protein